MNKLPWAKITVDTFAEDLSKASRLPLGAMERLHLNGKWSSPMSEERAETMLWPIDGELCGFHKHRNQSHPVTDGVFYKKDDPSDVIYTGCIRSLTKATGVSFDQSCKQGAERSLSTKEGLIEFVEGSDFWIICDVRRWEKHTYYLMSSYYLLDQVKRNLISLGESNKWEGRQFDQYFSFMISEKKAEVQNYKWDCNKLKLITME